MPSPYDETYDRRRLARVPHVIELRDRSLKDVTYPQWEGIAVRYNNRLIASYIACNAMGCWSTLTHRAGFNEPGVDVFVAPVPVGEAKFVSVAPITGDGPHECANCGNRVTV
jgi:hypothetical protein